MSFKEVIRTGKVLKAPFPYYFGGKSSVADVIWRALGQPKHYIEPFCGSAAVLLARPDYLPAKHMETICDKDGFVCVAPETKILSSDLRWKQAGDIQQGDVLLAFDEENPSCGGSPQKRSGTQSYRRWRESQVLAVERIVLPSYRLTFTDGTVVVASEDHCWLSGSHTASAKQGRSWRWMKTKNMICNRQSQRSWVLKLLEVTEQEMTWESGWMGGFYDGEGHLTTGPGFKLCLSQNNGIELDRAKNWLSAHDFDYRISERGKCRHLEIRGGQKETFRFLMLTRPSRLLRKLAQINNRVSVYGREHQAVGLVKKEFLGDREVVSITTSTHTFIAEGLASHNCNAWRGMQQAPDELARYCDWPVNHADLNARRKYLNEHSDLLVRLCDDPEFYDARIAGYWVWAMSCWIGSGLVRPKAMPDVTNAKGVHKGELFSPDKMKRPHLGNYGIGCNQDLSRNRPQVALQGGVHALCQIPPLSREGFGVNQQIPSIRDDRGINNQIPLLNHETGVCRRPTFGASGAHGVHKVSLVDEPPDEVPDVRDPYTPGLYTWFRELSERLRRVRVVCGDWDRVCGGDWQDDRGTCGMFFDTNETIGLFLDPPYDPEKCNRDPKIYTEESATVAAEVREWCRERGKKKTYRIVLAGYFEEHEILLDEGWTVHRWSAHGGFANRGKGNTQGAENRHKEALFFSPYCFSSGLRKWGIGEEVED